MGRNLSSKTLKIRESQREYPQALGVLNLGLERIILWEGVFVRDLLLLNYAV